MLRRENWLKKRSKTNKSKKIEKIRLNLIFLENVKKPEIKTQKIMKKKTILDQSESGETVLMKIKKAEAKVRKK